MGCTAEMMKCVLNTVNVLLGVSGIVVIVVTGLALQEESSSVSLYIALAVGGFLLLASLLGCCGICQENPHLTIAYAIVIGISFVLQLVQIFLGDKFEDITATAQATIFILWELEKTTPGAMDSIQQKRECCGPNSPADYATQLQRVPPKSCYEEEVISPTKLYTHGCIRALTEYNSTTQVSTWACLAFTGIMLLFAIYLVKFFRAKQCRYNY